MEGIGTIFGVIALFISLAALWFVNDVIKRVERQSQEFLESHLRAVKEAVDGCESQIAKLEKKASESARQITDLGKKDDEVLQSVVECQAAMSQIRADLEALDKSIPTSYRNARAGRRDG